MSDGYDFDVPPPTLKGGPGRPTSPLPGIILGLPCNGASKFIPHYKCTYAQCIASELRKAGKIAFSMSARNCVENGVAGVRVWRLDAE